MDWFFLLFVLNTVFLSSFRDSDGAALGSRRTGSSLRHCGMDNECKDGFYCYKAYESQICAPCVDCAGYNRLPGFRDCARSKLECGNCVPGYHPLGDRCSMVPDNFTQQGLIQSKDPLEKPFHHHHHTTNFPWWAATVTVLLIVIAAVFIAGLVIRGKCKFQGSTDPQEPVKLTDDPANEFQLGFQQQHYPSAPPPYNELFRDSFATSDSFPDGENSVVRVGTTAVVIEGSQRTNPVSRPDVPSGQQQQQQENGEENEGDDGGGDDGNNQEAMDAPLELFHAAHDLNHNIPNDGVAENNDNNNNADIIPMEDEGWEDEQDLDLPEHSINLEDHVAIPDEFVPETEYGHVVRHFGNIFPQNNHNNTIRNEDEPFFQLDMQLALRFVNNNEHQNDSTVAVSRGRNDSGLGDSPLRQSYDRLVPDLDNTNNADSADFPSTSTPRQNFGQLNYPGIYENSVNSALYTALDFLVNSFSDFSRDEVPMDEEISVNLG